jgi:fructosamine-3-kinase
MQKLKTVIKTAIGRRPTLVQPLHGGMVGEVYAVEMPGGEQLVAKFDPKQKAMLAREGYMLEYLNENTDFPVPDVLYSNDTLLLMTYVEGSSSFGTQAQEHAADLLANLHSETADQFGLENDTLIGPLHQPNPWTNRWLDFFREHRLLYMADVAYQAGRLSAVVRSRIDKLAAKLDQYVEEPDQPALIHGDLWTTNILAKDGCIEGFIDPAIYYGHPEVELAYTTLFGTFGEPFFKRYHALRPIAAGFFEERRDLYNLYPLLVHVRLFGGSYAASVDRTLRQYGV